MVRPRRDHHPAGPGADDPHPARHHAAQTGARRVLSGTQEALRRNPQTALRRAGPLRQRRVLGRVVRPLRAQGAGPAPTLPDPPGRRRSPGLAASARREESRHPWRAPGAHLRRVLLCATGQSGGERSGHLRPAASAERDHPGGLHRDQGPFGVRASGRRAG